MPLAVVMVHLDLDQPNEVRLRIARDIAMRFGAAVIGITACGPHPDARATGAFGLAMALIERDRQQGEEHIEETEQAFRAAMTGLDTSVEWRVAAANPATYVAQQARSADLVIAGASADALMPPFVYTLDMAELVLNAGRPLLLVPPDVQVFTGERIVIAWNDTREARRAVRDALPLLQNSEAVTVAEVIEGRAGDHRPSGADDVAAWLRRHGVPAGATVLAGPDGVAEQIDRLAAERAADLIVAGAYGRSRFREWVLGGATRDFLTAATRCVLLAH